jgi:hypothetical protein
MFHMSLSVTPSSQLSSLKFSHSILNPLVQSGHPSLQTLEKGKGSKAQWFMSIIPALGKMKENFKFKASLGYKAGPCIKKKKKQEAGCWWLTIIDAWEAEIRAPRFETKRPHL